MNIQIRCKDGVLTEEHLKELKEGEELELDNVEIMIFENCYISSDAFNKNKDSRG